MATLTQTQTGLTREKIAGLTPVALLGGSIVSGAMNATLNRQVFATAKEPGATAADNVLAVFSIPAEFFDAEGRGIHIIAAGDFGANVNAKTVKLIFNPATAVVGSTIGSGGTTIASTGAVTTNGSIFVVEASIFKVGAKGSNTQRSVGGLIQAGAAVVAPIATTSPTAIESNAILVAATGNAATAVADIGLRLFCIEAFN